MAYLVRVGRIEANASKRGARGYAVFRKDRKVTVQFGKVEAIGGGTTNFFWHHSPTTKSYPMCKTVEAARALARELVRRQLLGNVKGSYTRLPGRCRIYSASRKPAI